MIDLKPCPICGGNPDHLMSNLAGTEFKVGCSQCHVFTVASDGQRAQEMWNDICSKEVEKEPEPKLKPCPFCGSENITLTQDDLGYWGVECHGYACHAYLSNAKWACERKEDAVAMWNRRKEDEE